MPLAASSYVAATATQGSSPAGYKPTRGDKIFAAVVVVLTVIGAVAVLVLA